MTNRPPQNRTIRIHVDRQHKFHYTDLFDDGADVAHRLKLINGDRLAWVLDSSIVERTLQIDFGPINPFQNGVPISLRGIDYIVSREVNFPLSWGGMRILKYTVSLGNGWVDDPDVVPVPLDQAFTAQDHSDQCWISWKDPSTEVAIQLDSAVMSVASTDPNGETWQWGPGQTDTRPFTLEFLGTIPTGWPTSPIDSTTDAHPSVILYLPAGPQTSFRITTTKPDGNDTHVKGTLVIT